MTKQRMTVREAMEVARRAAEYADPTVGERAAVVLAAELERIRGNRDPQDDGGKPAARAEGVGDG
jgi:hypothetical protein